MFVAGALGNFKFITTQDTQNRSRASEPKVAPSMTPDQANFRFGARLMRRDGRAWRAGYATPLKAASEVAGD